ncbi:hypothetical protein, partial [Escherichia coli]
PGGKSPATSNVFKSRVYYSDRAVNTRIRAFIDFLSEHVKTAPGGAVREA